MSDEGDGDFFIDFIGSSKVCQVSELFSTVPFEKRAFPLLQHGIPTAPVEPGEKACRLLGWEELATTDHRQIRAWSQQQPNYNTAAVAKAEPNKTCTWFLEFDHVEALKQCQRETGIKFKELHTLKVQSRVGHYYFAFRQNAASIQMGNISVICKQARIEEDGEYFSARVHNRYMVGPLSQIDGRAEPYTIKDDSPICEAPPELIAWVSKWKNTRTNSSSNEGPIPEGARNSRLTSIAGRLRSGGLNQDELESALLRINEEQCQPPLSESEVWTISKSVARYPTDTVPKLTLDGREPGTNSTNTVTATTVASAPPPINISLPIDESLFYGISGRIIQKLRPETESHPVGNLLELLACFGSIIGPTAYFQVENTRHYANLFVVKVGKSSKSRKGTGRDRIRGIVQGLDDKWFKDRMASGLGSGEVVVWQVRDAVQGMVKDRRTGQMRYEITDPGIEDKRLYVSEGEFAGILTVASRKESTLSKIIRDAWDHNAIRNLAKSGSSACQNPHISISADITLEELRRQIRVEDQFNGFANRFLWCLVERTQLLPEGGQDIDWTEETLEILKAVDFARKQGRIFMDRNARLMWGRMYQKLSEDSIGGVVGAAISRGESQVLRLALIYALLDLSDHIKSEHLQAAKTLWSYAEDSARIIFGGVTRTQQDILDFLQGGPKSAADIREVLFKRNRTKEEIQRDLSILVALRRIDKTTDDRFMIPTQLTGLLLD